MHGRVKVRTTEEERERKKKEQVLKMRAYRAAMSRIQQKRSNGELDDEMLGLTAQMLQRNPDINTLWNIRRECVLRKAAELQKEAEAIAAAEKEAAAATAAASKAEEVESQEENPSEEAKKSEEEKTAVEQSEEKSQSESQEENQSEKREDTEEGKRSAVEKKLQAIYNKELELTEQCLMANPKSYNGWHHRCWTLEQNPQADWQRELQLCNKYLKYDERNFHTWDYRRYVCEKAGVPAEQELDFCTEKIKVNFSNYSSWHHRSLLLPKLFPSESRDRPMSEPKLQEELEMVLTAAFTDPDDTSAWFYQRWLLGSGVSSDQPATVAAFRCWTNKAQLAMQKSCPNLAEMKVQLISGEQTWPLNSWKAANNVFTLWQSEQPLELDASRNYVLAVGEERLQLSVHPTDQSLYCFVPPQATAKSCSKELLNVLESQLENCTDLWQTGPEDKWPLLARALLMRAIDANKSHTLTVDVLADLEKLDPMRRGYYQDLSARWQMEMSLAKWPASSDFPQRFELPCSMRRRPCSQYLIVADTIDENSSPFPYVNEKP